MVKVDDFFYLLSLSMLVVHTALLIFFKIIGVDLMFYINIGSVFLYLLSFGVVYLGKKKLLFWLIFFEVLIHMIFATVSCGWDCGFELYSFGLITCIFLIKICFVSSMALKTVTSVSTMIIFITYTMLGLYSYRNPPIYKVGYYVINVAFIVNCFISFAYIGFFLMFYIDRVAKNETQLKNEAILDELTALYNRRKLRTLLDGTYDDAVNDGKFFSVSILDIDDFKKINDTYGHDAGDEVLRTIATIMRNVCGQTDCAYVGRWGGEEFLIIQQFDSCSKIEMKNCFATVLGIHSVVRKTVFEFNDARVHVTISGGISFFDEGKSIKQVIESADELLYDAKKSGKDCIKGIF